MSKTLGSGPARVEALKHVELVLTDGELTVLMGPSGSGKTTLLSILGCMLTPTEGTVRVCGVSTEGAGAEQLALIRRERAVAARARARKVLAGVGLAHKTAAFPRELSGGEQQRLAVARAVVAEPSVVLADEPTAALDGVNGKAVMGIVAAIAKEEGRAVLVVSHDARLTGFADRIVHIEDGALTGEDRPHAYGQRLRSSA